VLPQTSSTSSSAIGRINFRLDDFYFQMQAQKKPASRLDSLKASRDMLELELHRMAAATDLLSKDAALLDATHDGHTIYSGTMQDANTLAKVYAEREARERMQIRLTFALFVLVACYVMGRRVAWTLAGVHIPGVWDGPRYLMAQFL
jgi:hypothetical protein